MSNAAWVLLALALLLLLVVLALAPLRIRWNLQGRGDPSGFWALAGGMQLGPFSLSGIAARGVEPVLHLHFAGRRVATRSLAELHQRIARREPEQDRPRTSLLEAYERLERWLDPQELLGFVVRERRRILLERVQADLDFSFDDVALTGQVLGAIYLLDGVLPPQIHVHGNPSWEFEDRASMAIAGSIKVWPGRLVIDAAWWLLTNARLRRRQAAGGATHLT